MQRLKGRSIVLVALAALACSGDPTENEGTPTAITANPDVVFVTQGDSQAVLVSVIDEEGQVLQTDVAASDVGSGITVSLDPTYQEVNTGTPIGRQHRFFVKGVDLTQTTFTLNALGLSKTVQVTSTPGSLAATVSNATPALGDTVSITAPTGTFFTDSSVLTFLGAAPQVVSQDATTIVFIPFPNISGPAVVSNVGVTSNPNIVFDLSTTTEFKTDSILDIGSAVTPTTPALGGTVTLTLPSTLRVIPESAATITVASLTPIPVRNVTVSPDSGTITFVPPPNVDSVVVVNGIVARRLPQYPLTVSTTVKVTTPVVDSIPANVSATAPAANQVVTLTTTDANFTIDTTATVTVGGAAAVVTTRTANSISFVPSPGDSGNVAVNGVLVVGFTQDLPSQAPTVLVGDAATLPATDDPATAPSMAAFTAAGDGSAIADLPDFAATVDHFYKVNIPVAGNYQLTVNWDIGDDVDAIICTTVACDTFAGPTPFAAASSNHPEQGVFALTAGDKWILVEDFGGADTDATTAPAIGATVTVSLVRQ